MSDRVHFHPNLIFSLGTQVVTLVDIPGSSGLVLHPRGTVGVIVKSPAVIILPVRRRRRPRADR